MTRTPSVDEIVAVAVAGLDDDARLREALTFLLSGGSALFVDDAAVIVVCGPAAERLLAAAGASGAPAPSRS